MIQKTSGAVSSYGSGAGGLAITPWLAQVEIFLGIVVGLLSVAVLCVRLYCDIKRAKGGKGSANR